MSPTLRVRTESAIAYETFRFTESFSKLSCRWSRRSRRHDQQSSGRNSVCLSCGQRLRYHESGSTPSTWNGRLHIGHLAKGMAGIIARSSDKPLRSQLPPTFGEHFKRACPENKKPRRNRSCGGAGTEKRQKPNLTLHFGGNARKFSGQRPDQATCLDRGRLSLCKCPEV